MIEENVKACDGNYKVYTELINRLEDVKNAIKKQNYGIAMDILYKPYPKIQITTSTELKESEDEKIRKWLLDFVQGLPDEGLDFHFYNLKKEQVLAWLEKQGKIVDEYEDRLDRCACKFYNKGYKAAIEHLKEKQGGQKPIMIQWTGDNLKEVVDFTGKSPKFEEWFKTWEDFENYVHTHNNIFKIFNEDGSHIEIPVGAWIVKTPDGYNIASRYVFKQKPADKAESSIYNIPSREVILAIWELGNDWKELTNYSISTEYGTQLDYIQKHWEESEYYLREKQSEQKLVDKNEPKFHEGEWLCENEPNNYARFIQIQKHETVNVQGKERYRISRDIHNDEDIVEFDFVEKHYHKFDIRDAKDGDVLATYLEDENNISPFIGIYRECGLDYFTSYCLIAPNGKFYTGDTGHDMIGIHPATKEQRDLLFTKMKEAGYEWDTEKRVLKKLAHQEVTKVSDQETSEWSEDDSRKSETLLSIIFDYAFYKDALDENKDLTGEYAELSDWLQFFPERFNLQPKQEWSEEDKARIKQLFGWLDTLKNYIHYDAFVSLALRRKRVDEVSGLEHWIKSLKDRVQLHNK